MKDALARLRAAKAAMLAKEAEEKAKEAEETAETERLAAEQAAKDAERGRSVALGWIETASYDSLLWVSTVAADHSERRAMVRGYLARNIDELFDKDLNDNTIDAATNAFFEAVNEVLKEIDGKR